MGQIDVAELLLDPDLVDPVILIRRTPDVDEYGENKLCEQSFPGYGSVQPASGRTIQRLPELLRVANVMSFWVQGQIISDGTCKYPDIIVWKGQRFAVQVVFDWTNWGTGWSEGVCIREKPTS